MMAAIVVYVVLSIAIAFHARTFLECAVLAGFAALIFLGAAQ